jgi:hypothetical protein
LFVDVFNGLNFSVPFEVKDGVQKTGDSRGAFEAVLKNVINARVIYSPGAVLWRLRAEMTP